MKFINHYLFLACAGTLLLTACSDSDEPDVPTIDPVVNYNVSLIMADNGFTLANGEKLTPGFTDGAKAGLFAVTSAGVITDSNVELTYDGTAWTSDKVINGGDRYFVYTPYKADAASKVSATATDAASFFAGLVSTYAIPGAEQGNFDTDVRPFDIVIASATVTAGRAESVTQNLSLAATGNHALAITSWALPGGTRYTTNSGFSYVTPDGAKAGEVRLGSQIITPANVGGYSAYFHAAGKTDNLTVNYILNEESKSGQVALDAAAGQQKVTQIGTAPTDGGRRELAVGDLFYRNGTVLPVENLSGMALAPAGVAGVIFCVDPARFSAAEKELLGNVHALVVSAKMGVSKDHRGRTSNYMTWQDAYGYGVKGDDGDGRFIDSQEDPNFPGLYLPLIEDHNDVAKSYEANNADINGYSHNKIVRARRSSEIAAGYYQAMAAIDYLNDNVAVTANTTGWYLPSMGQIFDYIRNIGGANISTSSAHRLYSAWDDADFDFGEAPTSGFRTKLDAAMAKVQSSEKDLFMSMDSNALWSSSYASVYSTHASKYMSGARQLAYDNDILICFGYDVIGKGSVRGVLAF